jgi:hypothetical protein
MRIAWLPIALALLGSTASAEDTINCKGWIVSVGMRAFEVKARCGEPERRDVERVPVRAQRADGSRYVRGYAQFEYWTYGRESGRLPAVLTFELATLKKIELITRH